MDATHQTNWLGWLLCTVMVRDAYGSWLPYSHFLTQFSDADIVAEALSTIKTWVKVDMRKEWDCRYFMTDDSAVEQKAVRETFGEVYVTHLLCRVYCDRTLQRNFAGD